MKKYLWILASVLALGLPAAFLAACGGSNGVIVLDLGPLGTVVLTNMVGAAQNACEGTTCSGDPTRAGGALVTIGNAGSESGDFFVSVNTSEGETFTVPSAGVSTTVGELVSGFITVVNTDRDNNGTADDPSWNAYAQPGAAGTFWVIPYDPNPANQSYETSTEATEGTIDYVEDNSGDAYGFLQLLAAFGAAEPTAQNMVDQAVTDNRINPAVDTERTLTLAAVSTLDCSSGTADLGTLYRVTIDANETVTDTLRHVQSMDFTDCAITGDLINDGAPDETLIVNGIRTTTSDFEGADELTVMDGSLDMDVSQSTDTDFQWVTPTAFDARYDSAAGEIDGGACLGGGVGHGTDDTDYLEDRCDDPAGRFVGAPFVLP